VCRGLRGWGARGRRGKGPSGADVQRPSEDPVLSGPLLFLAMALVDSDASLRASLRAVRAGGSVGGVVVLLGGSWGVWWPVGGAGRGHTGVRRQSFCAGVTRDAA